MIKRGRLVVRGLLLGTGLLFTFGGCSSDDPAEADAALDVVADPDSGADTEPEDAIDAEPEVESDAADTATDADVRSDADAPSDAAEPDGDARLDTDAADDVQADLESDATEPSDGAALYDEYCSFCHGADGEGYISDNANALANQSFLTTADDEFLTLATIHGRPGTPMSAWGVEKGGPLTDDDVSAVVAYIRAWQTEPSVELDAAPIEGNAIRGQGAYNANCAECHGDDGGGGTHISISNPWFLETASDAFIQYAIAEGREDTRMRGYADRLPERTVNDITALIRSWAVPVDTEPLPPYEPDLETALLNPDGPNPEWTLREARFVSIHDVHASLEAGDALMLVDARPTADFLTSHIDGAVNLPFYDVEEYVDALPRDRWIVTYCGCPHAVSGQAADVLFAAGFEQVAVLDEGFYEWQDAGYPVVE